MIKLVLTLKRKPGMTHEDFRAYYEKSHVEQAVKLFGHLMLAYRRNYLPTSAALCDGDPERVGKPQPEGVDVVTEVIFKDQASFDEFARKFNAPEINQWFVEDEKRFFDREASRMGIVEIVESDLGGSSNTPQ